MNPRRRRHNKRARRWRGFEWVTSPLGPIWSELRDEMVREDQRLWAKLLAEKLLPAGVTFDFDGPVKSAK